MKKAIKNKSSFFQIRKFVDNVVVDEVKVREGSIKPFHFGKSFNLKDKVFVGNKELAEFLEKNR